MTSIEKGEETYSLIFKSLKHPVRRKILRMLSNGAMTFTQILEALSIDSGHLSYHLENLGELVIHSPEGMYQLSSFGLAAVRLMSGVEEPKPTSTINRRLRVVEILCLLIAFSLLSVSLAFATMPNESYSAQGTFRYRIYSAPVWRNSTDEKAIVLYYGSLYEIAEPSLADTNSKLLKVEGAGVLYIEYAYGNQIPTTIFQAGFRGPDLPYKELSQFRYINVTELVSEGNVVNNTITVTFAVFLSGMQASIPDSHLQRAYIPSQYKQISRITVSVRNGIPFQLKSGNTTLTLTGELPEDNWTFDESLQLYNPDIIKAKEAIPLFLTTAVLLIAASALVAYIRKP